MDVRTDDELYRVDRRYLGPRGKPLPVQVPYRQWGLAVLTFVLLVILMRVTGLPLGLFQAGLIAAVSWLIAAWIEKHLTPDRPIVEEAHRVVQELIAPRPQDDETEPAQLHVSVPMWPADAEPDRRWYARLWHGIANRVMRAWRVITRQDSGQVYDEGEWTDV